VAAFHFGGGQAFQEILDHAGQGDAGGVGQGVVVGDVALGPAGTGQRRRRPVQAGQGHGQDAHGGTVAGVVLGGRRLRVAGLPEGDEVAADGIADVHGLAPHPGVEGLGGGAGIDAAGRQDGIPQGQRHGGVVGDLAGFQAQPAAAGDVAVGTVLLLDFSGGEEFDGGAEGIADGQAEIGGHRPVCAGRVVRGNPAPYRRRAGDQLSGPKHLA